MKIVLVVRCLKELRSVPQIYFNRFGMNCLGEIAAANNINLEPEVITIPDQPPCKEIKFPFFIRRDGDE